MKKLFWLFLSTTLLVGCLGDDIFSSSPSDRIVSDVDTLDLDTVVAGQGSMTHSFLLRNPNKKAIRIASIKLGQGSASPFRVNVTGDYMVNGHSTLKHDLYSGDSLRVFVEVTTKEDDTRDDIYESIDHIIITTDAGASTSVTLRAQSLNMIPTRACVINKDTEFFAKRPYQIFDSLVVSEGCTLTLKAGTRLYFHPDASLIVKGTLIAEGTLENPVVFRGDRLGMMFENQPYDRISSQWQGITFLESSKHNILNYCDIHSGKYGIVCHKTDIVIENTIIHNVQGNGLESYASNLFVANTQISNAGNDCVNLTGGEYEFIHCTIAHFYPFPDSTEDGAALRFCNALSNKEGNLDRMPLDKLLFCNSIITGKNNDEIFGDDKSPKSGDKPIPFVYGFQNCLLCTPKDENLIQKDCKWEEDAAKDTQRAKNFFPEFDYTTLVFPFTLNPASQAINSANAEISSLYPLDLKGKSRIATDNVPDIGCYELSNQ